jgi:hypothetical protein
MIQLRPDCLIFRTEDGDQIPCSAEFVTLELMGDAALDVDPDILRNASAAVLHFFKHERHQDSVSVAEFAEALGTVFRGLGINVSSETAEEPAPKAKTAPLRVAESDLRQLALAAGKGCELFFFPTLRDELKRKLDGSPQVVHFRGLHGCVKQLTGAERWSERCQILHDQIVDYLRICWSAEVNNRSCSLLVF